MLVEEFCIVGHDATVGPAVGCPRRIHHRNAIQCISCINRLVHTHFIEAKAGQKTPDGYYNTERMLRRVISKGKVLLCGTCMDARGLADNEILDGAERSTMDALAQETEHADKVLVF